MNRLPDIDQRDHDGDWEPEDETLFQCACLDPDCKGHNDDADNIKIGREWFAAHCKVAREHPEVVRSRELDALWDRVRR